MEAICLCGKKIDKNHKVFMTSLEEDEDEIDEEEEEESEEEFDDEVEEDLDNL